eukprot:TRINITY_DN63471_c0_g1_i1.p1 TRINITY_DN63471_c0_g1~~TRINITY_DN63471_c0_g1_i1.p1  ORF type:complete len:220 (-),score=31.92 TRINITY_DN63471_c0_g1_i1:211-798(-)
MSDSSFLTSGVSVAPTSNSGVHELNTMFLNEALPPAPPSVNHPVHSLQQQQGHQALCSLPSLHKPDIAVSPASTEAWPCSDGSTVGSSDSAKVPSTRSKVKPVSSKFLIKSLRDHVPVFQTLMEAGINIVSLERMISIMAPWPCPTRGSTDTLEQRLDLGEIRDAVIALLAHIPGVDAVCLSLLTRECLRRNRLT